MATGIGLLMWLGHIQGDGELNSTYLVVRESADWMVKSSIGAIFGYGGARVIGNGKRGDDA